MQYLKFFLLIPVFFSLNTFGGDIHYTQKNPQLVKLKWNQCLAAESSFENNRFAYEDPCEFLLEHSFTPAEYQLAFLTSRHLTKTGDPLEWTEYAKQPVASYMPTLTLAHNDELAPASRAYGILYMLHYYSNERPQLKNSYSAMIKLVGQLVPELEAPYVKEELLMQINRNMINESWLDGVDSKTKDKIRNFLIRVRSEVLTRDDDGLWSLTGPYAGYTRKEFKKEVNASRPFILSNLDYLINYDPNDIYGPENRRIVIKEVPESDLAGNLAYKQGDQLIAVFMTSFEEHPGDPHSVKVRQSGVQLISRGGELSLHSLNVSPTSEVWETTAAILDHHNNNRF